MTYEVVAVRENGKEDWLPCLDAVELDDGRLAAELAADPGGVVFRKPGRWRKVSAPKEIAVQP